MKYTLQIETECAYNLTCIATLARLLEDQEDADLPADAVVKSLTTLIVSAHNYLNGDNDSYPYVYEWESMVLNLNRMISVAEERMAAQLAEGKATINLIQLFGNDTEKN